MTYPAHITTARRRRISLHEPIAALMFAVVLWLFGLSLALVARHLERNTHARNTEEAFR